MKEKIKAVTNSITFRHTSQVTGATVVNGFLGFIFYWLLARMYSPSVLGIFTIVVTTASLITDVSTVGTETGVVNFVGKFIKTEKEKAYKFLKVALEIKICISILIIIFGWFLMPTVANDLFHKSDLVIPLRFALFGAASGLLFGFSTSSLQSLQKFSIWGFLNIFSNASRLLIVSLLFVLGMLSLNSGLLTYIIVPFAAFLISFLFLPNFLKVKNERQVLSQFFHYNKWVAIFTLIAAISSRLDMFFVTRFLTLTDVGIYSVAVTLSGVIPQLVGAVGTVIAPKLAGLDTKEKAIKYLKKLQLFVGALCLIGIFAGGIIGYVFIRKFYPEAYFGSFFSFVILLIAQAMFLFSVPVHMTVIYYFSYPKLFVLISIVNIVIVSIVGWILIPSIGYTGAAIAVLSGNILNFVIPTIWVFDKFKK